jgi:hypothetical protein
MKMLLVVMAMLVCVFAVGCFDEVIVGRDLFYQDGKDNDMCPSCSDGDDPCPHPIVEFSCKSSIGLNPTGCHGGVVPDEPLPDAIPWR